MGIWSGVANRARMISDPRYRHFYATRNIRDLAAREASADRLAGNLPKAPVVSSETVEQRTADLDREGYVMLPDLLSPEQVKSMSAYFAQQQCSDPYQPKASKFIGPQNAPPGTHVAFFDPQQVLNAPHALAIANNPTSLATVGRILKAKPTISYMAAWWSIPHGEGAQHAELFHRDRDDLRFIKLFCYLTDVDEGSGPHIFVKQSHKINKLNSLGRYSEEEVAETFGAGNIIRFTGPAGTAFLENTYGMHRGFPPTEKPRLMFFVMYSLTPTLGGPRSPVKPFVANIDGVQLDPFINRIYLKSGNKRVRPWR